MQFTNLALPSTSDSSRWLVPAHLAQKSVASGLVVSSSDLWINLSRKKGHISQPMGGGSSPWSNYVISIFSTSTAAKNRVVPCIQPMSSERTMVPMVLVVASRRLSLRIWNPSTKPCGRVFRPWTMPMPKSSPTTDAWTCFLDLFGDSEKKGRCAPMEKGAMEIQMEIQHATCS